MIVFYHKREAMKTDCGFFLFAALVPHRDAIFVVEKFRQRLFALGLDGAFSFPAAAPLALLSRPLTDTELKSAAAELRQLLAGGKFAVSAPPKKSPAPDGIRFFGLSLDMPFPSFPEDAVIIRWEKPVLAPAVLGQADQVSLLAEQGRLPDPPELSFRAAALANLAVYPAGDGEADYSYAWEPGRLHWLPRPAENRRKQTGG
jgi:hypothetical protein